MKKNIYIISLYSPENGSGIEKVTKELGLGLKNLYNVSFLFSGKRDKIYVSNGIKFIQYKVIDLPIIREFLLSYKINKFIRKNNNGIIIDSIGGMFYNLIFYKLKKNFKLIFLSHGSVKGAKLSIHYWNSNFLYKIMAHIYYYFYGIFTEIVIKHSDYIITLSKYLKKEIEEFYKISKEKIHIIYNGFDCVNLDFIKHKNNKNLNVIFVGNDLKRKGGDIIENVANNINNNIKFSVIGMQSNEKNTTNKIMYLGKMDRESLYKFMNNSDVIFLPSYYEGQPLVLFEAMNLGCIPVFSKECHMDMVEDTILKQFISNNNTSNSYIDIFNSLIKNIDKIDDLRKLSKEIIKNYSWDNQIKEYIKFINTIDG